MYYVLSLCGYEEYDPRWFECDCSKEEFEKTVKEVVHESMKEILATDRFIGGHEILDVIVPKLAKKFKLLQADYELRFGGECLYTETERSEIVAVDKDWEDILKHNKKIHDELYNRRRKKQ